MGNLCPQRPSEGNATSEQIRRDATEETVEITQPSKDTSQYGPDTNLWWSDVICLSRQAAPNTVHGMIEQWLEKQVQYVLNVQVISDSTNVTPISTTNDTDEEKVAVALSKHFIHQKVELALDSSASSASWSDCLSFIQKAHDAQAKLVLYSGGKRGHVQLLKADESGSKDSVYIGACVLVLLGYVAKTQSWQSIVEAENARKLLPPYPSPSTDNSSNVPDGVREVYGKVCRLYYESDIDSQPVALDDPVTTTAELASINVETDVDARLSVIAATPVDNERKLSDYTIVRTVRKTLLGKVKLAIDNQTDTTVAIKMSRKFPDKKMLEDPLEEVKYLRVSSHNLGHPCVIRLLGEHEERLSSKPSGVWLWTVLEYAGKGELFDKIAHSGAVSVSLAKKYFKQAMQGVKHLHGLGIAHLDLSLENLLISDSGDIKICDMGQAQFFTRVGEGKNSKVQFMPGHLRPDGSQPGKTGYMAPEIFAGVDFDPVAADVYSCGVILFLCLFGIPPYNLPTMEDKRFGLIYTGKLDYLLKMWKLTDSVPSSAVQLLTQIICPQHERIGVDEILASPFLQD